MSREEAITRYNAIKARGDFCEYLNKEMVEMAIQALSQEPCEDAISRQAVLSKIKEVCFSEEWTQFRLDNGSNGQRDFLINYIEQLPSVTQKSGKCKNCKYFEYDSVAKVDGIPLIVAHEICNKWGDGCKTKEDGYCYLFEPQERSE